MKHAVMYWFCLFFQVPVKKVTAGNQNNPVKSHKCNFLRKTGERLPSKALVYMAIIPATA